MIAPKFDNVKDSDEQIKKIGKQAVLYMHVEGSNYTCAECIVYIKDKQRCLWMSKNEIVLPTDTCGVWIHGVPQTKVEPLEIFNGDQLGLTHTKDGTSCKKCNYFNGLNKCQKVDENSPGDDSGMIHPSACCNDWEEIKNA